MAAAGLPAVQRRRPSSSASLAAAVLRIVFSLFTVQLLQIIGLLLAGGLLLLWVAWKLWRELRAGALADAEAEEPTSGARRRWRRPRCRRRAAREELPRRGHPDRRRRRLDVARQRAGGRRRGARAHEVVLIFGLALSVALMGLAATLIARLLHRYRWIAYAGLAIILYVALRMIWDGAHEVAGAVPV